MKELKLVEDEILDCKVAKVNFSSDLGECYLSIITSSSNIAHFYIENNQYKIGICLFKSLYYGIDEDNVRFLSNKEKSELYEVLIHNDNHFPELHENDNSKTIWERLRDMWEISCGLYSNYLEQSRLKDTKIPNYLELFSEE